MTQKTLSEATNTRTGTTEQGALKTIHRDYNKLNGFEAMLHIINRYRFVLLPFIVLSVAGSTYSFYNDFIVAFPMLGDTAIIFLALFFSVMLEIVRDGSLIAIFNSKMKLPSRLLVIVIFIAVTSYLYSSHLKAIKVIEDRAVAYTLAHQTEKEAIATNPRYEFALAQVERYKNKIENKKSEITDQLLKNTTSVYKAKRKDAIAQKANIEAQISNLEQQLDKAQQELISLKNSNIESVKDSQKIISSVLLATLILIETLAMLGAVIKFINKDNADKEIAKHSEIVEQYESISEQMRKTNDELGLMLSRDIESVGNSNLAYAKALTENRAMMQNQINELMQVFSQTPMVNIAQPTTQTRKRPPMENSIIEPMPTERKIGFNIAKDKKEIIKALYQNGAVTEGNKLTSKNKVVNTTKRQDNQFMTNFYKELEQNGIIENRGVGRKGGYYATADYQTALQSIGETVQPNAPTFTPLEATEEIENQLTQDISKYYNDVWFVKLSKQMKSTIVTVFFKGEAIDKKDNHLVIFGRDLKDYNKPINPLLEKRIPTIHEIVYPFLTS